MIGSPTRWDRSAALTSTLHWFETELLTREENLVGLMAVNRDVIGQAETLDRSDRTVLDMDSSESPVHGQQEGSAYNGHFESVCYHPLFLFNNHGSYHSFTTTSEEDPSEPTRIKWNFVTMDSVESHRRGDSVLIWFSMLTAPE
jgi:hypothetical protein